MTEHLNSLHDYVKTTVINPHNTQSTVSGLAERSQDQLWIRQLPLPAEIATQGSVYNKFLILVTLAFYFQPGIRPDDCNDPSSTIA
ncbi:unnamed protein product [Dibothriocephalus latus]|uniref:Uncharacterized protein n=1 Tax=Dibothriocephalus latus TaxID=60516 RepID=A0A3P7LHF9_DIBLA|nr:unnamed protein product [Dibothriocephalus latus]